MQDLLLSKITFFIVRNSFTFNFTFFQNIALNSIFLLLQEAFHQKLQSGASREIKAMSVYVKQQEKKIQNLPIINCPRVQKKKKKHKASLL